MLQYIVELLMYDIILSVCTTRRQIDKMQKSDKKDKLANAMKVIREKRDISASMQRKQTDVLGDIRNIYFKKNK